MMMLFIICYLVNNLLTQSIHAPELVSGQSVSLEIIGCRVGYVDGGGTQFLQIGKRSDSIETGVFVFVYGDEIDNDNMPVPYRVTWRNSHKYNGYIIYRGHERKLCAANSRDNLPCH